MEIVRFKNDRKVRHYFLDETGTPEVFSRRKRSILSKAGSAKIFGIGLAHLADPIAVEESLEELRAELLADESLKHKESMKPERKRTALYFHASKDLPPVRERVFELLQTLEMRVYVVFRRKSFLEWYARNRSEDGGANHSDPKFVYDNVMMHLLTRRLHRSEHVNLVYARRGKSDRRKAAENAIAKAKRAFFRMTRKLSRQLTMAEVSLESAHPSEHGGLQVVDYCLWALQRLILKGEVKYFEPLRDRFRAIVDFDDRRHSDYGEVYTFKNPLTLEKMKPI